MNCSHLLHCMQSSTVSTHTAADDDQVIVIFGRCCLGNDCQALAPADPGIHLPVEADNMYSRQLLWQFHGSGTLQLSGRAVSDSIVFIQYL